MGLPFFFERALMVELEKPSENNSSKWSARCSLKSGDIGKLTYLHGILYSKEYEYDQTFEAYVAAGLVDLVLSYNSEKDRIWLAEIKDEIIGSIAIAKRSDKDAQLRWYLVHPDYRRQSLGKYLMEAALKF